MTTYANHGDTESTNATRSYLKDSKIKALCASFVTIVSLWLPDVISYNVPYTIVTKKSGCMKPLPHGSSRSLVGLDATTCSSVWPLLFSF